MKKLFYICKIILLSMVMVAVLNSCQIKTKKEIDFSKNVYTIDQISKRLDYMTIDIDTLLDENSFSFVALETKADVLLSTISSVFFADSSIVVVDRHMNQIVLFSKSGKFIRKIGKHGKGPNEYLEISDCRYNKYKKTIEVVDNYLNFISYDLNGNPSSDDISGLKNAVAIYFHPIDKNLYATYNSYSCTVNTIKNDINYAFGIYTKTGEASFQDLPFSNKDISLVNSPTQFFETEKGDLNFYIAEIPVVYTVDKKGLHQSYVLDFEGVDKKVYEEDDFLVDFYKGQNKFLPRLEKFVDSDRYLLIEYTIDRVIQSCLYDKKNKKTLRVTTSGFQINSLGINPYGGFFNKGDEWVYALSSLEILNTQQMFKNPHNKGIKRNQHIVNEVLSLDVTRNSNPVLFFFKFKK